eukprot:TRINITY_DN926_c0_g2_i1.p1 TRINITY_DN926_c0_g2~~TRINITY_DN926_c0_g2_i1.p1  ORF type:complete len:434 (-),score=114.13 TRINITY_DN926_c0_g2_i1:101-1366(-)
MEDEPDGRIQWIGQQVCKGLHVPYATFHSLMIRGDSNLRYKIMDILDGNQSSVDTLLFYIVEDAKAEKKNKQAVSSAISSSSSSSSSNSTATYSLGMAFQHFPEHINELASMYFCQINPGKPVFVKNGRSESAQAQIADVMTSEYEFGILCGHSLIMLEQVLSEVYIPLLGNRNYTKTVTSQQAAPQSALISAVIPRVLQDSKFLSNAGEGRFNDTLRNEFLASTQRFTLQVTHAMQQVKSDVRLTIPDLPDEPVSTCVQDFDLITTLEATLDEWTSAISTAVEFQLDQKPKGPGPLAEIEHWRDRNASLSTLYEQLSTPTVKKILEILKAVESQNLMFFTYQFGELTKFYMEAKDNVKFLTTLERHFKNISSENSSLTIILDTLPSMMNAIRMVWIISRHYNTDERKLTTNLFSSFVPHP